MMKRYQVYGLWILIALILYTGLLLLSMSSQADVALTQCKNIFGYHDFPLSVQDIQMRLYILPWYGLIVLGCYCLYRLGVDLLKFRDCSVEETLKLEQVRLMYIQSYSAYIYTYKYKA